MIDIIRNGLKNIRRKRLRSTLTIAGIAIGVLSVVVISMIGDIGKAIINDELASMGIGGIIVTSDVEKSSVLSDSELEQVRQDSAVQQASPLLTQYSAVRIKNTTSDCMLWGVDTATMQIVSMELLHGRMITAGDVAAQSRVCMVDESFALEHYERSNIVGKTIDLAFDGNYETFTIVGITKAGGNLLQSLIGNVVPCFAYIPYTTMQSLSMEAGFTQIVAQTSETADTATLSQRLTTQITTADGGSIKVDDLNSQMSKLNNILDTVSLVLTVIAGISLLVAGLSIMTVMLVSVSERTREIGIKKSIGASRKIILLEFLSESFLLTVLGGSIGIAVGLTLGILGCLTLGVPILINVGTLVLCMSFAVIVGMVFGIYPAMKAASLKPVDALRG